MKPEINAVLNAQLKTAFIIHPKIYAEPNVSKWEIQRRVARAKHAATHLKQEINVKVSG